MAEEHKDESKEEAGSEFAPVEINLDSDGPVDWMSAMAELEEMEKKGSEQKPAKPPEKKSEEPKAEDAPAEAEVPAEGGEEKPAPEEKPRQNSRDRIKELSRKPAVNIKKDDLDVIDELSEILSHVNSGMNRLKRFERDHPYLIAPNILRLWEDNLRETSTMMLREFHQLRHGKQNKTYDEKYVCKECKTVFMVPLPSDRLCDECRAKSIPRTSPY